MHARDFKPCARLGRKYEPPTSSDLWSYRSRAYSYLGQCDLSAILFAISCPSHKFGRFSDSFLYSYTTNRTSMLEKRDGLSLSAAHLSMCFTRRNCSRRWSSRRVLTKRCSICRTKRKPIGSSTPLNERVRTGLPKPFNTLFDSRSHPCVMDGKHQESCVNSGYSPCFGTLPNLFPPST